MKPTVELNDGRLCIVGRDSVSGANVFIVIPDGMKPAYDVPDNWFGALVREMGRASEDTRVGDVLVQLGVFVPTRDLDVQ